ncbi:SRPBCC family protein [Paenibacillus aestuarii]|uniref:SRPBCC family protein n=1 Tax=Paenibacillus aestuarii TaxID=516965 RepID=A0ABW0KDT3_9BACL|nr:SRPBCC family protein [Paenibacillus aestuarii]
MVTVSAEIEIRAPIELCFDMARNIEIHTQTVWKHTQERVVAGRTSGLIGEGETVTFQAKHFLIRQKLTSRVTDYIRPYKFVDEMKSGAFKNMRHEHEFIDLGNRTLMKDTLYFEAPFGIIGWIVERVILKEYMKRFLTFRNKQLKEIAERAI